MNTVSNLTLIHNYILTFFVIYLLIAFDCQFSWKRKKEQELKRQSEFLTDIAHRLKTPLTFIFLNIDLAKRFFIEKDFSLAEKSLFSAKQATAKLSQLTSNLIVLGKINYGLVKIRKTHFDLSVLVKKTADDFRILIGKRQLTIKVEPNIKFYGDQAKLQEMILNLLDNANKFTDSEGGKIEVSLSQRDQRIKLVISDNGQGIKAKHLPHLFDRYYQAHQQTKSGSAGIGLAIVKWIVKSHDGKIEVESKEGKGTKFIIYFDKISHQQIKNNGK